MNPIESITMKGGRPLAAAVLAGAALLAPATSQAAPQKLVGSVGPGFSISLKTAAGKKVTVLKPGVYAITINDRSRIHDFRLRGPGVNRAFSGVAATGTRTATVRLSAGRYQFACQPHASAMNGSFKVR